MWSVAEKIVLAAACVGASAPRAPRGPVPKNGVPPNHESPDASQASGWAPTSSGTGRVTPDSSQSSGTGNSSGSTVQPCRYTDFRLRAGTATPIFADLSRISTPEEPAPQNQNPAAAASNVGTHHHHGRFAGGHRAEDRPVQEVGEPDEAFEKRRGAHYMRIDRNEQRRDTYRISGTIRRAIREAFFGRGSGLPRWMIPYIWRTLKNDPEGRPGGVPWRDHHDVWREQWQQLSLRLDVEYIGSDSHDDGSGTFKPPPPPGPPPPFTGASAASYQPPVLPEVPLPIDGYSNFTYYNASTGLYQPAPPAEPAPPAAFAGSSQQEVPPPFPAGADDHNHGPAGVHVAAAAAAFDTSYHPAHDDPRTARSPRTNSAVVDAALPGNDAPEGPAAASGSGAEGTTPVPAVVTAPAVVHGWGFAADQQQQGSPPFANPAARVRSSLPSYYRPIPGRNYDVRTPNGRPLLRIDRYPGSRAPITIFEVLDEDGEEHLLAPTMDGDRLEWLTNLPDAPDGVFRVISRGQDAHRSRSSEYSAGGSSAGPAQSSVPPNYLPASPNFPCPAAPVATAGLNLDSSQGVPSGGVANTNFANTNSGTHPGGTRPAAGPPQQYPGPAAPSNDGPPPMHVGAYRENRAAHRPPPQPYAAAAAFDNRFVSREEQEEQQKFYIDQARANGILSDQPHVRRNNYHNGAVPHVAASAAPFVSREHAAEFERLQQYGHRYRVSRVIRQAQERQERQRGTVQPWMDYYIQKEFENQNGNAAAATVYNHRRRRH